MSHTTERRRNPEESRQLRVRAAGLGHAGLALSTSIVAIFSFIALMWSMRNRIGGIYGPDLLATLMKVTAASMAMGAVCYGSSHLLRQWLGLARWARLADLSVSILPGVAVFYAIARALRVAEMEMA